MHGNIPVHWAQTYEHREALVQGKRCVVNADCFAFPKVGDLGDSTTTDCSVFF